MRVNLKGLHSTKKKLADGSIKTYWYAWKNGPALPGVPGGNTFMAAYNEAIAAKPAPAAGALQSILDAFQASTDWDELADRTRRDYIGLIKIIEKRFAVYNNPQGGVVRGPASSRPADAMRAELVVERQLGNLIPRHGPAGLDAAVGALADGLRDQVKRINSWRSEIMDAAKIGEPAVGQLLRKKEDELCLWIYEAMLEVKAVGEAQQEKGIDWRSGKLGGDAE